MSSVFAIVYYVAVLIASVIGTYFMAISDKPYSPEEFVLFVFLCVASLVAGAVILNDAVPRKEKCCQDGDPHVY